MPFYPKSPSEIHLNRNSRGGQLPPPAPPLPTPMRKMETVWQSCLAWKASTFTFFRSNLFLGAVSNQSGAF